jgi:signal recognition particle subunit SRP54
MGDVLSLIEKAESAVDAEKARDLERKMRTQTFTFEDFLDQLQQVRKMGPLEDMLSMIPGAQKVKGLKNMQVDEKQLAHTEAIIRSMTKNERENPEKINASCRKRIAGGSGTTVAEVNRLLKQFTDMKKMMKGFSGMMKGTKKKGVKFPFLS